MALGFPMIHGGGKQVKIVSFSTGTWEEIKAMLEAHYAGKINVAKYWSVGDKRTISLSDIIQQRVNGGAGYCTMNSQSAMSLDFVIIGINHSTDILTTSINGVTHPAITLEAFAQPTSLQPYNAGYDDAKYAQWASSAMRAWLSYYFYYALPSDVRTLIKQVNKKTYRYVCGNTSLRGSVTSADTIFLLSGWERCGSDWFSDASAYGADSASLSGAQYAYYKNKSSKYVGTSSSVLITRNGYVLYQYGAYSTATCVIDNNDNKTTYRTSFAGGWLPAFCM